jgi:hypothetical protein
MARSETRAGGRGGGRVALVAVLLAALLLAALAPGARADERPPRAVGIHRRGGWLGVSVSLRDLFGPTDGERLRSGFVSRVVLRVELYPEGSKQPIAVANRRADVLYDLWDERFRVAVVDRYGIKSFLVPSERDAIELSTTLLAFEVTELARLRPGAAYRLRFRADLNPLSEDLVAEVKKWLVRPAGRGGAGDSMFGSMVSIFVNPEIENSERQITFWSQAFVAVPPAVLPEAPRAVTPGAMPGARR